MAVARSAVAANRARARVRSAAAPCISGPQARAFRSTCGTFHMSLEMGVTRPGTLPRRGAWCDRRAAAFRSRAYRPGSTDRRRAEASVKRASEERCEGRVWRGLLRSHRVIGFADPKYSQISKLFLPRVFFLDSPASLSFLRDTSSSRDLQTDPGRCRAMQINPEESRQRQDAAGQSKVFQGIAGSNRTAQIHPGTCRDAQQDTGSVVAARWSFVCQQNCTRPHSLIA